MDDTNMRGVAEDMTLDEAEKIKEKEESTKEDSEKTDGDKLKKKYSKLKKKYDQSKKEFDTLKEKHSMVQSELEAQSGKITDLNVTIQRLKEQIDGGASKSSSGTDLREKAKQTDGLQIQAEFLTRQVVDTRENERYLREQVSEAMEAREESERKMKDLQVRLKRFIKDDQTKDERILRMELELKEITQQVDELEKYVDQEQLKRIRSGSPVSNGGQKSTTSEKSKELSEKPSSSQQSKSCEIL
ncbi:uncharacterized protein LOC102802738 [Saccoglossus kowalevskii]|uniref:DNA ligase 1-like n=1 Tax=Saccoglossus kowalevskii TaxID=10224 RepID=A0ABM0M454_SACKO|nr:PREDICTED: DNA ligase 1-like [Saccoglossus kowalevskii]